MDDLFGNPREAARQEALRKAREVVPEYLIQRYLADGDDPHYFVHRYRAYLKKKQAEKKWLNRQ